MKHRAACLRQLSYLLGDHCHIRSVIANSSVSRLSVTLLRPTRDACINILYKRSDCVHARRACDCIHGNQSRYGYSQPHAVRFYNYKQLRPIVPAASVA